jgi:hypothetical protein
MIVPDAAACVIGIRNRADRRRLRRGDPGASPRSLFKRIHGIVRKTDSLRLERAQHMKSYGQIIEICCKNQNG